MQRLFVFGSYTIDLINEEIRVGGPALFSSIGAMFLGFNPFVMGLIGRDFPYDPPFSGRLIVDENTIIFRHVYDLAGNRKSILIHKPTRVVGIGDLEGLSLDSRSLVVVNPVIHEFSEELVQHLVDSLLFIAIDLQGFLRSVDKDGIIVLREPDKSLLRILEKAFIIKLSLDEYKALGKKLGDIFVVTLGRKGAVAYLKSRGERIYSPAYVVKGDPTGAGDIFLSTFLIKYWETEDVLESLAYANAVASMLIDGSFFSRKILSKEDVSELGRIILRKKSELMNILEERKDTILRRTITSPSS